jgi:hypothetical protein
MRLYELRQYTLLPGRREDLIAVFEEHFVDGQNACGMEVLGRYRDLDREERFVWMRSFEQAQREPALTSFYTGPVWKAHSPTANATMVDVDDVLLLHEPWAGSFFVPDDPYLVVTIWSLPDAGLPDLAGISDGLLVTAEVPNDFPALPVREGEHVVVAFGTEPSTALPYPAHHVRLTRV